MVEVKFYDDIEDSLLVFVVIISKFPHHFELKSLKNKESLATNLVC